jgi:enoyl-CoA hydratase/carnithine racemase
LLPPDDPSRQRVSRLLGQCKQFLALDQKLATILEGTEVPASDAERLGLADLCQQPFKRCYATSARLRSESFVNNAKLADNLQAWHRYDAACCAALAAAGQGEDARSLPDKVSFRLRQQALDWLRADLTAYARLAEGDAPAKQLVRERLTHWKQDEELVSVREAKSLAQLPEPERQA